MQPERARNWAQLAVTLWVIVVTAVAVRSLLRPRDRTLFTTWARAGQDWENGEDLYRSSWEPHQDQFRYSPLVAVSLVPFGHLSEGVGGAVWRLLNATVLLGGFAWWLRNTQAGPLRPGEAAIAFLLLLPLSIGSLNNGQPNPLVIGLLLIAAAAANRDRWWLAALCVMGATAWKVYPLAVGLLIVAGFPRRFGPWLALALLAWLLLPFLFQRWDYVLRQYQLWFARLGGDDRKVWPPHMAYRDLWLLLQVCHIHISTTLYTLVQGATAAGAAGIVVLARRRGWERREVLLAVVVLGCCWMTLLGPATESATYVVLAPVLAWAVLESSRQARGQGETAVGKWPAGVRWVPATAWGVFLLAVLAGLSPGPTTTPPPDLHPFAIVADSLRQGRFPATNQLHALGLHPAGALLLTLACLLGMLRALAAARRGTAAPSASPPARAA
jgi:hypothetical protein